MFRAVIELTFFWIFVYLCAFLNTYMAYIALVVIPPLYAVVFLKARKEKKEMKVVDYSGVTRD